MTGQELIDLRERAAKALGWHREQRGMEDSRWVKTEGATECFCQFWRPDQRWDQCLPLLQKVKDSKAEEGDFGGFLCPLLIIPDNLFENGRVYAWALMDWWYLQLTEAERCLAVCEAAVKMLEGGCRDDIPLNGAV